MSVVHIESHIDLGEDSDCETCGSTYNSVDVSFGVDESGRLVDASMHTSVGCYGGDDVKGIDAVRQLLLEYAALWTEAAAGLRALVRFMDSLPDLPETVAVGD